VRWTLAAVLFLTLALAQTPTGEPPPDLSPEVFRIASQLRCPVCQGESAAESNAGVSQEMRRQIAEMLKEGKSEEAIREYFVKRYGEWILYAPPKKGINWLLWLAPVIGVGAIGLGLWRYLAEARRREAELALSEEELKALERRLEEE